MTPDLTIALGAVFVMVAIVAGALASVVVERTAPERRRLNELLGGAGGAGAVVAGPTTLTNAPTAAAERVARLIPKSPKDMGRLRRRMALAGFTSEYAAVFFSAIEIVLPAIGFITLVWFRGVSRGFLLAI